MNVNEWHCSYDLSSVIISWITVSYMANNWLKLKIKFYQSLLSAILAYHPTYSDTIRFNSGAFKERPIWPMTTDSTLTVINSSRNSFNVSYFDFDNKQQTASAGISYKLNRKQGKSINQYYSMFSENLFSTITFHREDGETRSMSVPGYRNR